MRDREQIALSEYRRATDEAHEVYVKTATLAWEYYQRATAAAWEAYQKALTERPSEPDVVR